MKKELFDELLESLHEGGEILRNEREPARMTSFEEPHVDQGTMPDADKPLDAD